MPEDVIKLFSRRSERYPEAAEADTALAIGRAALTSIPVIGGAVTELVSVVLSPSIENRRKEWLKEIADSLEELEESFDSFKIEALGTNERFVSAVIEASRSAISTHKVEKRELLKNALLNIALQRSTDEDQEEMFLRYIDELTVWHIKILRFFSSPSRALRENNVRNSYSAASISTLLEDCFSELRGRREFYDQIAADLSSRGLFNSLQALHALMSASGLEAKRTTPVADRFLDFISSPLPAHTDRTQANQLGGTMDERKDCGTTNSIRI